VICSPCAAPTAAASGEAAAQDNAHDKRAGAAPRQVVTPQAALRLGTAGARSRCVRRALVAAAIEGEVETVVLRTGGDLGSGG